MATSARCRFCADLSIEHLVSLAKDQLEGFHLFSHQAFYQHQPSFTELEKSAENGCDLCSLILRCFKGTPSASGELATENTSQPARGPPPMFFDDWPQEWLGAACQPADSMYALAKRLADSSVRMVLSSDHLHACKPQLSPVTGALLDTLLVQLGPEAAPCDEFGCEPPGYLVLPVLPLTLTVLTGCVPIFLQCVHQSRSSWLANLFLQAIRWLSATTPSAA